MRTEILRFTFLPDAPLSLHLPPSQSVSHICSHTPLYLPLPFSLTLSPTQPLSLLVPLLHTTFPPHPSLSPTITVSPRSPALPRWRSVPRCFGCQWGGTENSVRTSLSGTYNPIKIYKQSIRSIFMVNIFTSLSLALSLSLSLSHALSILFFLFAPYVTVFICCRALPYG